jgi:hypothetical protein
MVVINNVTEVLHRIRAKLYPNYLHGIEGAFIARTDDEASLGIEQICAALKNRGGFTRTWWSMCASFSTRPPTSSATAFP